MRELPHLHTKNTWEEKEQFYFTTGGLVMQCVSHCCMRVCCQKVGNYLSERILLSHLFLASLS